VLYFPFSEATPFWPLLGAIEGRRCLVGLVDRLGTKRRLVTVEGRFLTLGGQRTPARCWQMRGRPRNRPAGAAPEAVEAAYVLDRAGFIHRSCG